MSLVCGQIYRPLGGHRVESVGSVRGSSPERVDDPSLMGGDRHRQGGGGTVKGSR